MVLLNENNRDITVVIDVSWQRRGHISLNVIVPATSLSNGK